MSRHDPSKPLLFAAMPFGRKREPGGVREVDFDALYDSCIEPAAATADVEVIRADEETLGGIIHRPMYERLLLAEIVVADLTFANANVFYELGVRHAARPRSTILIYAKVGALPFDVAPVRALPYGLDDGGALVDPGGLHDALVERFELAKTDDFVDSPLFQLLEDYQGIDLAPGSTEAFRARALWISDLTIRCKEAVKAGADRAAALRTLGEVEAQMRTLPQVEDQLMTTLVYAYRSLEAWDEMIRVIDGLPRALRSVAAVREQLALALNRRGGPGDIQQAIETVRAVIAEHGESSEALAILGGCFKRRWEKKAQTGDAGASVALDAAIDAYERGFDADPRDFYPGVNFLTLLAQRGQADDLKRLQELAPVVEFAIARMGGVRSTDYWTVASALEIAVIQGDEPLARRAASALLDCRHDDWMRETTADNVAILAGVMPAFGYDPGWVEDVVSAIRRGPR